MSETTINNRVTAMTGTDYPIVQHEIARSRCDIEQCRLLTIRDLVG